MALHFSPGSSHTHSLIEFRLNHFVHVAFLVIVNGYVICFSFFLLLRVVVHHVWWLDLLNNFIPLFFLPLLILIPLALVLGNLGTLLRLLILVVIAAGWFGPYFFPKASGTNQEKAVRIATLNADVWNTHVEEIEAWLRTTSPDIVCIQEAPNDWITKNISEHLSDLYPYHRDLISLDDRETKVFLSRFPILETSQFALATSDPFFHQRIAVETPLGALAIYNVHLMPNYGDTPRYPLRPYNPLAYIALSYDESFRELEIEELFQRIAAEPLPYVVAGDFNTSNFSQLYDLLSNSMRDSFREAGTGFGMTWPAVTSGSITKLVSPFLRLDYIWHSNTLKATSAWVGKNVGSDHYPLTSDLTFR